MSQFFWKKAFLLAIATGAVKAHSWGSPKKKETAMDQKASKKQTTDNIKEELLIRFVDEKAFQKRSQILEKYALEEKDVIRQGKLVNVKISSKQSIEELIKILEKEDSIKYAEPNFKLSIHQ